MTARGDRILGLALLVLAVAYGWAAQQWPAPFGGHEAVGPETFPTILSVVLALSSCYLIAKPDPDAHWPWGRTAIELVMAVGILVVYALVLEPLGFIPATTVAVGTLCWRMGAGPKGAFITGLVSAVVVFFLFNNLLELSLPAGLLAFE
ncbi:tripartite tricarboxylate transporter TctB family protein [Saccharospirillum salsuginis]|uniref:Membrane protein n=1 Tax=Saccharospirillum salsuginis TaxID=418750 RepID=A0A918N8T3_9GAMM|nr:tripartite tricarboxylate transporter TctB family protein [Saccharospirillum salsuginis]GGX48830.1 membrane protein [Saccharospirillum salsuginis]